MATTQSRQNKKRKHTFHFGYDKEAGINIKIAVPLKDGKKTIRLARVKQDVKKGLQGQAMACADVVCAKRHKKLFPHAIHLADFTRTRAYIVDKVSKDGLPISCVAYKHNDPTIKIFDKPGGKSKLLASRDAEREIVLSPPPGFRKQRSRPLGQPSGDRDKKVSRGALKRAQDAGIIDTFIKKRTKTG